MWKQWYSFYQQYDYQPQETFKQQPITLETKGSKKLHDNYVRYGGRALP